MRFLFALGVGLTLMTGCASAQDPLSGPLALRYFEGPYAGVSFTTLASQPNFWPGGGRELAYGGGASVGYNHYLTDDLILGGELEAGIGYDLVGNVRYDVLALGHIGFLTDQYFQAHFTGGVGWYNSAPAYAVGVGFDWALMDNLSYRAKVLGIGQIGNIPGVVNFPGFSGWHFSTGFAWQFGEGLNARPQDTIFAPRNDRTDFEGLYTAAYVGFIFNPTFNFFVNQGFGLHQTRLSYGAAAGWNVAIGDMLRAGIEVQGGLLHDSSGDVTTDTFVLGRLGVVPMEGLFVYGSGGVGMLQGRGAYAVGGGAEYAFWGDASIRAEALAIGAFSGGGFTATKIAVGPVWHFD